MLSDRFFAWPSGPVIPAVYDCFVMYQDGVMAPVSSAGHQPLDGKMEAAIEKVFRDTVSRDTHRLVQDTHVSGGPWQTVYNDNDELFQSEVTKESMYKYYRDRDLFLRDA